MGEFYGYGIIGCGWVAPGHAWGVRALSDESVDLIAVADIDTDAAAELASRFDIPHAFRNYEDVLSRDDIHAVSVCLPDFLHREVVVAAAHAGKHVLCEKPLAMNLEEADEMLEACEASDVRLGLIMNHRYFPDNIRTKNALLASALGDLLMGSVLHSSGLTGPLDTSPWRGKVGRAAGGVLSTQAIHFLDLLLWFLGPVRSVKALTEKLRWHNQDYEDTAVLALHFQSGALATLTTTNGSPIMDDFTGTRIEVHGTSGWLMLEGDEMRTYEANSGYQPPEVVLPDIPSGAEDFIFGPGHIHEVVDFVRAARTGVAAPVPGVDARHLMAVLEAAYASAADNTEVVVEEHRTPYSGGMPDGSLLNLATDSAN